MSGLADPIEHDELLNYRLKRLVNLGGAPAIRLCEGRYGVTRHQWRVLAALVESGPMSPSMLAVRAQQERAIVSRQVTGLVSKGLIQRVDRNWRPTPCRTWRNAGRPTLVRHAVPAVGADQPAADGGVGCRRGSRARSRCSAS